MTMSHECIGFRQRGMLTLIKARIVDIKDRVLGGDVGRQKEKRVKQQQQNLVCFHNGLIYLTPA